MPQKMYPQWQQTWENRADEIDQHIVDCCATPNAKLTDVTDKVRTKVNGYLQTEGQTPLERNDPALGTDFQSKVQERVQFLQREGRIKKENAPKTS